MILDRAGLGTNSPLTADVVLAAMGLGTVTDDDEATDTVTTNLEPARIGSS